jgi:AcrR family transcriptional regulator
MLTQMDRSPQMLGDRLHGVEGDAALRALPMLEPARPGRADAARNRVAVLEAAERLVATHGADAVTMDQIAHAARVGKGTLFRHFGDRCGLMRALLDERERSFQEDFIRGPAPLGPGAAARERLVAFGERMLDHIEIQGDLLAAAENGAPGQRLRHIVYAAYHVHVSKLLEDAGSRVDGRYIADVLLGALSTELVLHQRRVLAMPAPHLKQCWRELVHALLDTRQAGSQR